MTSSAPELDGPDRDGPDRDDPRRRWQQLGFGLLALEALVLVVMAVVQLVDVVTGHGDVLRNELMLVVTLLIAAGGLVLVALGVLRGRTAVRTAGVFWQILLLAVVWFMWQAGLQWLAIIVLAVAVVSAVAIVQATRSR